MKGQPTPTDTLFRVLQSYRPGLTQVVRIASTQRCRPRHPRTPPTGRDAALSHRRDLPPEVSCPAGGRRRIPAAFRPTGVRRLPEVRLARTRVSTRQVRRLPSRAPGGFFAQATRLLSILRRTSDGGVGSTSRRSRPAGATHPSVGADLPLPAARIRFMAMHGPARHCNATNLWIAAGSSPLSARHIFPMAAPGPRWCRRRLDS